MREASASCIERVTRGKECLSSWHSTKALQASQDQHQAYFCLSLDNEDGKHL